jgi:hypothetical protein
MVKKTKDKLIIFENPDKESTENWSMKTSLMDFPSPFRMIIAAPPSTGKTSLIMNLILYQEKPKPFDNILIYHHAPERTDEYNIILQNENVEFVDHFPLESELDPSKKNLVIIDDVYVAKLKPKPMEDFNRLFGYVSTHHNTSVILTTQVFTKVPAEIRRMAQIFVIGKPKDTRQLDRISDFLDIDVKLFKYAFRKYMKKPHDTLTVDTTTNSPCKYRFNLLDKFPIDFDYDSDSEEDEIMEKKIKKIIRR